MAKEPRVKVAIHGYYGFHNVGDEAILSVILEELRREVPNVEPVALSADPVWTEQLHGVKAVNSHDLKEVAACIREADLVISGGGGLFQEYWPRDNAEMLAFPAEGGAYYAQVPLLAKLYGKPLALLAHGIGPIRTQEGANLVRVVTGIADRITVRDEGSQKLLEQLGRAEKVVRVAPDPAFAFPIPPREEARKLLAESVRLPLDPGQIVIAVCVRPWQEDSPDWPERLAEGLDRFLADTDAMAVFVPFHEFEHNSDVAQGKSIIEGMSQSDRCFALRETPPADVAAILAGCDAVLAMRMHATIFAIAAGVPVLALAYDPKVSEAMRQAGQAENTLQLHALDPQSVSARLRELLEQAAPIPSLQKTASKLAGQVRAHFTGLEELARQPDALPAGFQPAQPPPPRDHNRARLTAERQLEESRSALTGRVTDLQFQLDEAERRSHEYFLDKEAYIGALLGELRKARSLGLIGLFSLMRWVASKVLWPARLLLRRSGVEEVGPRSILRGMAPGSLKLLYKEIRYTGLAETYRGKVVVYHEGTSPFPGYSPQAHLTKPTDRKRTGVSLVVTVRNEAESARGWCYSLLKQSRLPDELIIVDGGSSDETVDIIQRFAREASFPVQVVTLKDANIAEGRNTGIARASHPVIATTDLGCELDPRWLELLISPFEFDSTLDVVAGWYEPRSRALLGRAAALELAPGLSQVDPASVVPSSRSIAFKKEAFGAIGGYPEWLTQTGEDTYLALELKRRFPNWAFVPDAKVFWHAPNSLFGGLKKAYSWAKGDGEAGLFSARHWGLLKTSVRDLTFLGVAALFLILSFIVSLWLLLVPALMIPGALVYLLSQAASGPVWRRRQGEITTLTVFLWALIYPIMRIARAYGFLRGVRNRPASLARRTAHVRGVAFVLSGVPISDSGGGQRAAQLALTLLEQGHLVVFINRFPSYENIDLQLRISHPLLLTYSSGSFDLSAFRARYRFLADEPTVAIVEFPLAEFADLATEIRHAGGKVIYDCIDDWTTSLGGDWYSLETEKRVIEFSDVLVATALPLKRRLEEISGRPVALVPNAVNTDLFRPDGTYPRPHDLPLGEFVICYIGALWGEWFDWRLLLKIAQAYPRASVAVIGDYRGQCPDPPDNLCFLGLKPQRELPAYLAYADVTIVPWSVSRLTHATNPLKVYEYLAMSKPVVAPRIQGLEGIPYVLLSDSDEEFIANIDEARAIEIDDSVIGAFIQENSWPQRVSTLMRLVADGGPVQPEGSTVESSGSLAQ